ncbi:MAG: hypothetical protein ACE5FL_06390, partial [Myxococcota bacterium]
MPERAEENHRWAATDRSAAILRRPFASLSSRMVMSVLVATLMTTLLVTWLSTGSISAFLRREVDRKFLNALHGVDQRLDAWYRQRELDMATFAQSGVLTESFQHLTS